MKHSQCSHFKKDFASFSGIHIFSVYITFLTFSEIEPFNISVYSWTKGQFSFYSNKNSRLGDIHTRWGKAIFSHTLLSHWIQYFEILLDVPWLKWRYFLSLHFSYEVLETLLHYIIVILWYISCCNSHSICFNKEIYFYHILSPLQSISYHVQ